ncbi:MAG: LacI family DNA-binding transcriptional regulator [Verrucomicrobiota bacterium]
MSTFQNIPTYEEIALKSGVSPKTVCNVLRSPESVRKKNVDAVHKALRDLGVGNPEVMMVRRRSTRPRQAKSIVFIESGAAAGSLNLPVFSRIVQGAQKRAYLLGWQFVMHFCDPSKPIDEVVRNFRGGGVLLFSHHLPFCELERASPGIAVVRIFAAPNHRSDCDCVDYDRIEVARLAAIHLHEKGCKKVGYLGQMGVRQSAFLSAATDLGLQIVDASVNDLFIADESSQIINRIALKAAWAKLSHSSPDGIFVYSDQITNALYALLAEQGVRPGRDIEIVSCNAEDIFLSVLNPRPATIDICSAEIGARAVDALIWRMKNHNASPCSVIIRPKLIPGTP